MQPTFEPSGTFGDKLVPQTNADDRRPADREGRRLGVVRGRLGRTPPADRTRPATRTAPGRRARTRTTIRRRSSSIRSARIWCSSTTTSRSAYYTNYAPGTPGRAHLQDEANFLNLISASSKQGNDCDLKPVSLLEADRRGERASGLREHRERQQQARQRPEVDSGERLCQEHDGDRHLRRVRRPVGSRLAAGPGQRQRPARPVRAGHAHPGADLRARI